MLDVFAYFGIFWQAAIVIGIACVLASTAWGIIETKHRKRSDDF